MERIEIAEVTPPIFASIWVLDATSAFGPNVGVKVDDDIGLEADEVESEVAELWVAVVRVIDLELSVVVLDVGSTFDVADRSEWDVLGLLYVGVILGIHDKSAEGKRNGFEPTESYWLEDYDSNVRIMTRIKMDH